MKLTNCFLIVGLCAFILQFSVINCVDEAEDGGTEVAQETTNTDTEVVEETSDTEVVEETAAEDTEGVEETETSNTEVEEEVSEDATNSETTNDATDEESTDTEADSDTEVEEVDIDATEAEIYVPPVGTELDFTLDTATSGLSVNIYFTQMESSLSMHCEVTAAAGTDAADLWPEEFASDDASESDSAEADANEVSSDDGSEADSSDADSVEGDANIITNDAEDSENTDTVNEDETVEEASDAVDDVNNDSETVDTETDAVGDDVADTDGDAVADTVGDAVSDNGRKIQARGSCTTDMPYIYLLKETSCCSDPTAAACASTEAYKLGCIDKTGSSDHDFPDLKYSEVENYCLAITDKQADSANRLRSPKFIASRPSFFRTFSLLNFNNVNFLSSGTKTITSNPSTGSVSLNFPAYIQPSPGGSYTPGFFDTLPHIRLEGLTADYINVIILLLLLTYVGSIFLPALGLGPLISQFTAPFERMGDYMAERIDVLENKVKASIRKYHRRRYYNDVRRVDYHNDYEYIDDDYYYYDK